MIYSLEFLPPALEEWRELPEAVCAQFKRKLRVWCEAPRVPKSQLRGATKRFKIKLLSLGYRLVYEVDDATVTVIVVAVGRRDKSLVYKAAQSR
ncbi:type II toxin-antitoxin system RelE family toxin [Pseudogemmobacter bohemicus]|uniref:type II toxin-antitoxin system RelE family toxin n=1 Tax=Pseudogemmobacter bohemicus TaxID=2250708 RepID=UPI000DD3CF37|nr:type II toxin-antitoxin system RelE/ParE family toxin [Pseudogemmobacter bohemicus]